MQVTSYGGFEDMVTPRCYQTVILKLWSLKIFYFFFTSLTILLIVASDKIALRPLQGGS